MCLAYSRHCRRRWLRRVRCHIILSLQTTLCPLRGGVLSRWQSCQLLRLLGLPSITGGLFRSLFRRTLRSCLFKVFIAHHSRLPVIFDLVARRTLASLFIVAKNSFCSKMRARSAKESKVALASFCTCFCKRCFCDSSSTCASCLIRLCSAATAPADTGVTGVKNVVA